MTDELPELSRRLLQSDADPADCLLAAAAHGYFPTHQPPGGFADRASLARYLLQHLERRPYRVRPAMPSDLPSLLALEEGCWAQALRTPSAVLERRIARDAQAQLVAVVDDEVAGVMYSQRIAGVEALEGITAADVDWLHDPLAGLVQLLAVNVAPGMQQRNLGDELLELMLTWRSLDEGVQSVVAVTLCRDFDAGAGIAMEDYIRRRNAHDVLADPILRFHELHGATVERVMPDYRPADVRNAGCGVLVRYDIRHRRRTDLRVESPAGASATSLADTRRDVRDAVCERLGEARRAAFDFDRPLMEMGLDSADLLALAEALAHRHRVPVTPAHFFRQNTAARVAQYLADQRVPASRRADEEARRGDGEAQANPAAHRADPGAERDVAIVGMACRLPGGIDSPEAFWRCLQEGRSVVGALPAGRWQWPADIDPAHRHKGIDRGAFLDDVAAFDAPFFRISPAEAETMDPQQRLLLELAWEVLEHAGHSPAALAGSRTGVFIGASGSDYARLLDQASVPVEAHFATGGSLAILANRISYFFDFCGPSLVLDTACSSSLVALHEAVRSIQSGECAQALAGGVNLMLHPAASIAYYKAGMLSKDGICRTFDGQADGYVRGEGAVAFLLKPLQAAREDGDRIYAVIRGTACNHGGQAGGLTVPNPGLQKRLLQAAWESARIDPLSPGYIEAHGTGTPLGDPIEFEGIEQARTASAGTAGWRDDHRCGVGSVKTNLGHLEAAAGVAGLLKAVLCLQHRQLPPSLHFRQLNAHIPPSATGLFVVDRLQPWTPPADGGPRIAGVSSFGSGGTNAHVVVAEYREEADPVAPSAGEPMVFVLSARTREQLQEQARRFADWLAAGDGRSASLADLAWQLQAGRQAMPVRLAFVTSGRQELIDKLSGFGSGADADPRVHHSGSHAVPAAFGDLTQGEAGQAFLRTLVSQGDLDRIALLWAAGAAVDWSLLHGRRRHRRIAAPTYPFARHRYWLPGTIASPGSPAAQGDAVSAEPPASDAIATTLLAPSWQPVIDDANDAGSELLDSRDRVFAIGASARLIRALRSLHGDVTAVDSESALDADSLKRGRVHFFWVAPAPEADGGATLLEQQEAGVMRLFRLVKAVLASSGGDRDLAWTVVTCGTQSVFGGDAVEPAHAGVHGLAGAMAREHPRWTVRCLDVESESDLCADEPMRVPAAAHGDILAWRGGQWFRRVLVPAKGLAHAPLPYRQKGVYVVVGGAGGIGEAWTRHVVEHCQAQVIWIGRRAADEVIRAKIASLAALGPAPVYVAADATDRESLQAARESLRRSWPAIHGVVHSAVGAFDRSLAVTDESAFRDILSAKVDASVNLAQVFADESLDFLLYFSSIVALERSGGMGGYAAGGAFEDAYALHLAGKLACAVKVINWGHWDIGTGAAVSAATWKRLRQSGFAPIQPTEAMSALHGLLAAPVHQLALVKCARLEVLPMARADEELEFGAAAVARCIDRLPAVPAALRSRDEALGSSSLFNNAALDALLLPLLAGTLQSPGLPGESGAGAMVPVTEFHRRWLDASRDLLAERGFQDADSGGLAQAWRDWEEAKRSLPGRTDLAAAMALAEACVRALPDILAGRQRATDVIFPGASMRRVEGVYRDNAVADHFNLVLADRLEAAIAVRLQREPGARLRILEIGAGTGGTTATVLARLARYRENIAEYTYSDVSRAFLFHAEEHFAKRHPAVRTRLFDVERPLAGQDIEARSYDFAIATNVLHATRDIRMTLANAKATLRRNGLMLLNEIGTRSLFAHLTFGLLEGWWLPQDPSLRLPRSPALSPEGWERVLRQAGFATVVFPVPEAHMLGQQVILAESDGVTWQRHLAPRASASATATADEKPDTATRPGASGDLKAAAVAIAKAKVARVLRMDAARIDTREPLETYGIDSILVVQITDALREDFPAIDNTLLFQCPTLDALGEHLARQPRRDEASPSAAPAAPRAGGRDFDAIAVIGMSCRFPGASTPAEYWRVLAAGQDRIREVPPDRWPMEGFFHADPDEAVERGKSYGKWGGFLDGVTEFDPLFFNISPRDAACIDPQERLFLQAAWEALEDAGCTREHLLKEYRQQVGVFAGITRTGFDLFGPDLWRQGLALHPHTSFSSVANRLSYFLNVRGPSVPVDTMCSSSLTAIHQACQSLRSGECRLAIAGGVNLYLHPSGYVGLSASRMLSPDGVCRSFGKAGNGFVPGEGVAAVLLKPLTEAIADNDRIYATIRATHVNHGGRTNGYTVPNPQAQEELVREALRKAGVDARAVSYIEAHGTGTELGDPIEVAGLTQAFRHDTTDCGYCALGSAKSNIGHLEAAAGIAGFIKVVLQLQHGQLAPTLHADEPNPGIAFERTPFVLQRTLAPWRRPLLVDGGEAREGARIAGVSSFGAGGANAHVIVEEYCEPERAPAADAGECLVVLSARNAERLRAGAGRLRDFLAERNADGAPPDLADVAYTLQVGREAMEERLAFVARTPGEVREGLDAYLDGRSDAAVVFTGNVRDHREVIGAFVDDDAMQETLSTWFRQGRHAKLLALWVQGLRVDWQKLHRDRHDAGRAPRRIGLPTYPFATTRCWLPLAKDEPAVAVKPVRIALADAVAAPAAPQAAPALRQVALRPLQEFSARDAATTPATGVEVGAAERLRDLGDGIFAIDAKDFAGVGFAAEDAAAALIACLGRASERARDGNARVLLLGGLDRLDAPSVGGTVTPALREAVAAIAQFPLPVVAMLAGAHRRAALLLAAACDLMILCAEGSYDFAPIGSDADVDVRFAARFGEAEYARIVARGGAVDGRAMRAAGVRAPVVAQAALNAYALDMARDIARAPGAALAEIKKHLAAGGTAGQEEAFAWPAGARTAGRDEPQRVDLDSAVVTLHRHGDGVAVVTLCDRAARNTASPDFVRGVLAAFAHIRATPGYKAVVLTGYENYFACGGTREGLLAIHAGRSRFTDERSYSAPLECDIPVIAAMQGHAIGAGWAMGLYCDWAVYAEESVYQSPYLQFGFTPGAGSTLVFPARLGDLLGREILLTAREFPGRELKERGIPMPVLPRAQVLDAALALARELASQPREQLVREKEKRFRVLRQRLQATFAQELAMHERTFVGNAEVAGNISRRFEELTAPADARSLPSPRASGQPPVREVLETLRQILADELAMPREDVDEETAFIDLGMDSISAVTWVRKVNRRFGVSLAATRVYSSPNLARFAELVAEQAVSTAPAAATAAEVTVVECPVDEPVRESGDSARSDGALATAIAIIGMSGQFPKAGDVRQFWRNVVQGRDCVSEIPATRWSIDAYYDADRNAPGKTVCRRMGVLDDVDVFDPLFFSISPAEAECMDPQQRLFLQNSWRCIEDAGYDPGDLSGKLCGVFVGCAAGDYAQLMAGQPHSAQGLIGESVAILPARIAYFLNLQGPCLAIDTACSASLVALASACDSLVLGNSDLALAGGVYVINGPDIHVKMSKAGMLSPDGRCYSFDGRANGFVPGEGVGVLLLKRLADAERDGDDIYGVIRGWGVNQDGKSNGITAPNQDSQARLETAVYEKFGIDPDDIGLVEAHGTGTALGDPIEVEALRAAFRRHTGRRGYCALGSVKSNIGHLATAAGVSGVIKSVLALEHGLLPPTIHYERPNEHIDLDDSPFYVNTQCRPWQAQPGRRRLVAVSSFGFSGTNAHMVLQESEPARGAPSTPGREGMLVLLPLSARSPEQLAHYAQALAGHLADGFDSRATSLADLAWTFQVGRAEMAHRLAIVACSVDELRARLAAYADTGTTDAHGVTGEAGKVEASRDSPASPDAGWTQHLLAVARRWVAGEAIDWKSLQPCAGVRRRHGLPTYPFARERYWTPGSLPADAPPQPSAVPVDQREIAPAQPAPAEPGAWRGCALEEATDWAQRLRDCLARKVLVVTPGDHDRREFDALLAQLAQACGVQASANLAYCSPAEIAAALATERPEVVVLHGGAGKPPADVATLASAMEAVAGRGAAGPVELVVFAPTNPAGAERLAAHLPRENRPGARRCLLVTRDEEGDTNAAMQSLFKEWLAFGASQEASTACTEIRYSRGDRLRRIRVADAQADEVCLIRKAWRAKAPVPQTHPAARGAALVLVNHESVTVARRIVALEGFRKVILVADTSISPSQIQNSINFGDPTSAGISAQILIDHHDDITHIVDLSDLYEAPRDGDADHPGKAVFLQAMIGACRDLAILHVTKGLQHLGGVPMSLAGARFAGLVKMLSADYRHVNARCVDIDQSAWDEPGQLREILVREFAAKLQETEICYRGGERYAPALQLDEEGTEALRRVQPPRIAADGVYVVSGGTNGVGLEIAKYLAGRGCKKLVLMGITPLPPRAKWPQALAGESLTPYLKDKLLALTELERTVEHLEIHTGSLARRASLQRYFRRIRARLGPVRGVVHAAGAYSDAGTPGFVDKKLEAMQAVWEPKVGGLESLHAIFKSDSLDFFVSLSSMTGIVPNLARGAGDYAMANAFVDFFTAFQHHRHGRTGYRSIAWSDWNETGAITRAGRDRAEAIAATFRALGMRTFDNAEGRALFELALGCPARSGVVIGHVDREAFARASAEILYARPARLDPPRPVAAPPAAAIAVAAAQPSIVSRIEQWEAEKRAGLEVPVRRITEVIDMDGIRRLEPALVHRIHRLLFGEGSRQPAPQAPVDYAEVIASTVMEVLKLKSIDPGRSFQNYGLDSISATVLATRLEKRLRMPVQPHWLIEFSTTQALSRHLQALACGQVPQ